MNKGQTSQAMNFGAAGRDNELWTDAHEQGPVATISITKVVIEHVQIARAASSKGQSFGEIIDTHLEECALRGDIVESLEFSVNRDYWMEKVRAPR